MKEKDILLEDGKFIIDGKPFFFYSGEIHYFRTPYSKWREFLRRAREANLNAVSTYIPWRWHEYEEGKFDFSGATVKERDLLTFMKMAEAEGLYLFLRAGPICHAEVIDSGLPAWLLDNYPQVRLKKADGSYADRDFISFLNPTYQEFVRKWYEKVIPLIVPHQVTRNGKVILVQLDNEISMVNWLSKQPDYGRQAKGLYQDFLKKKYKDIRDLNGAYQSHFMDFSKIDFPVPSSEKQPGSKYWDWAFFWREYYATYYEFLAKTARSLGIEVPVVANIAHFIDFDVYGRGIYSPMNSSLFKSFPVKVENLVLGGAYQMRRLDYENFHDVAVTTEIVKMVSDENSPSICVELQSGVIFDRPLLYPSDVDLNIFTSCAHGLNGVNCYMFSSGKNPDGMGWLGTIHDWQAPIGLDGKPRPHYEPIKKWGKVFKAFGAVLPSSKKEHDISVGFYAPYYMTQYLKGDFAAKLESQRNRFFFDGICRLLEICGYNFKIVDLQSGDLEEEKDIFVFSLDFMDRETQEKLYKFVKKGGNLIIGPDLPERDLSCSKCEYLKEKLGLKPKTTTCKFIRKGADLITAEPPIKVFGSDQGTPLFKTGIGDNCAVLKSIGDGKVIAFSFGLTHLFNYHADIIEALLKKTGIKPRVINKDREIKTVVRSAGDTAFLFVANYHQLDKDVKLDLPERVGKIPSKGSFMMPARSCRILPLNFHVTDGVDIIKTTAQIVEVIKTGRGIGLIVEVTPCAEEEIVLDITGPKSIKIDGERFTPLTTGKRCVLRFVPRSSRSNIEIGLKS